MAEYKFEGQEHVSTAEFHRDREEADHLHQDGHRVRLEIVAYRVQELVRQKKVKSWRDYGCGNGGLLSLVKLNDKKGFDFQPANVNAKRYDVDIVYSDFTKFDLEETDLATMTEVLEHMDDPHGFLKRLPVKYLIASVPEGETPAGHDACHRWGWDQEGFSDMLVGAGFEPMEQFGGGGTQVWLARRKS